MMDWTRRQRARWLHTLLTGLLMSGVARMGVAQEKPDSADRAGKRPTKLAELVTTASRTSQAVGESPANVTAVTRGDLATSSAPSVPDLLWRLPGFATRDFQTSLAKSPVRGVVSFRGLAGSSAGRTLILLDGVPLNEPFSGWMHWSRVPLSLVERVEVVRGGGSMLWGSRALGGVVNVLTASPERTGVQVVAEGGGYATYRGSVSGGVRTGRFRASVAADWSNSNGFVVTRPDQIGTVDAPSGGEDRVIYGKLSYDVTPGMRLSLTGSYLDQQRNGPTELSDASAGIGELRTGLRWATSGGGVLDVTAYGGRTTYQQLTTIVSRDRNTVAPGRHQQVPASSFGTLMQWSQMAFRRHQLTTGLDVSLTDGSLAEQANYRQGQPTLERKISGRQMLGGVFLQDNFMLSDRWRLLAGLRGDWVRNADGGRHDTDLVTGTTVLDTSYAAETHSRLNYSLGLRHDATGSLAWRAGVYGAYRAPTPYELYQTNYSSRGAITAANPSLLPERLFGAEVGADLTLGERALGRVTAFWNRVNDPVVDYTVGTSTANGEIIEPCGALPKDQVCRQRRNVSGLQTAGLETELEYHPSGAWSLWGSYAFNPTWIQAPGQQIDGVVARGAARHAASAVVTYDNPRVVTLTLEERYVGSRSDDDLNTIRLDRFLVTGFRLSRRLWGLSSGYLKIDNLFGAQYEVAHASNGYAEVGAPRWVTVGLRAAW